MIVNAFRLWRDWIAANAIGELLGLGLVAGCGALSLLFLRWLPPFLAALGMILAGGVEGAIVGALQWSVLRRALLSLPPRSWIAATITGAIVAWALGMLPSMIFSSSSTDFAPPELGELAQLGLAALLGSITGPILALFQWRVLRRHLQRTAWWIPANAIAWMFGMPLIFFAAGGMPPGGPSLFFIAEALALFAAAGAVVGMVHGAALIALLRSS